MAVAAYSHFIAQSLFQCLTENDADIFYGMMIIDMEIAFASNVQINHSMTGDLVKHML